MRQGERAEQVWDWLWGAGAAPSGLMPRPGVIRAENCCFLGHRSQTEEVVHGGQALYRLVRTLKACMKTSGVLSQNSAPRCQTRAKSTQACPPHCGVRVEPIIGMLCANDWNSRNPGLAPLKSRPVTPVTFVQLRTWGLSPESGEIFLLENPLLKVPQNLHL